MLMFFAGCAATVCLIFLLFAAFCAGSAAERANR